MAKKKGNKEVLETVNYSIDIVKDIKSGKQFTKEEKQEILDKFTGMSKDNNSYWTPVSICNFIKDLLDIKSTNNEPIRICDTSAGVGNMAIPFITQYGKLQNNIEFDLYELDENTSAAGEVAWSDYKQVNYHSNYDSLKGDIPDNYYDFVLGNPPFTGSVEYSAQWNQTKGKKKPKANIVDAFVDLAIRKTKDKGYIALVLPIGHLFRGNSTQKLREWMRTQVSIKFISPLDSDTFSSAGISGTAVGTVLIVFQKGVPQDTIFYGQLTDKSELKLEMKSMAEQFKIVNSNNYEIEYHSDYLNGLHGILKERN